MLTAAGLSTAGNKAGMHSPSAALFCSLFGVIDLIKTLLDNPASLDNVEPSSTTVATTQVTSEVSTSTPAPVEEQKAVAIDDPAPTLTNPEAAPAPVELTPAEKEAQVNAEVEKRKKRAERFGASQDDDKKQERAERFGTDKPEEQVSQVRVKEMSCFNLADYICHMHRQLTSLIKPYLKSARKKSEERKPLRTAPLLRLHHLQKPLLLPKRLLHLLQRRRPSTRLSRLQTKRRNASEKSASVLQRSVAILGCDRAC